MHLGSRFVLPSRGVMRFGRLRPQSFLCFVGWGNLQAFRSRRQRPAHEPADRCMNGSELARSVSGGLTLHGIYMLLVSALLVYFCASDENGGDHEHRIGERLSVAAERRTGGVLSWREGSPRAG